MRSFRKHIVIGAVAMMTMAVSSCRLTGRTTSPSPNSPMKSAKNESVKRLDKRYQYFFLEAIRQQNAGNYANAFELLSHCREINPDAAEVYYHLSRYYSSLKKNPETLQCLEKAAALNPENDAYLEQLAMYYAVSRDFDKAIEAYERLVSNHPDRTDILNILIQMYQERKDYDQMIATINRIETAEGDNEEITLSKMRVYEMQGNKQAAYKELRSLVQKHPNDLVYKTMMGNWLMQNDRQKEAYKAFMEVLKEEPDNAYAESSLYDYYKTVGEDSLARHLLEKILLGKKTETNTRIVMMRQVIQDNESQGGDSTEILSLFNRMLAQPQVNSDIAELKAAYMSLKKMPEDSINNALRQVLDISPDNANARLQLIQNIWPQQDYDEIIRICQPALEYNPDEMAFYYFMGLAYYQKDDRDEALSVFRKGVSQINERSNRELASDFYAIMGDIMHQKGLSEEAFVAYDSCLQYKDDNIGCLNNYAYYLSEENRDLAKAEQMSYKTIKAEPTNATYLDTYAWILFMQERYAEAKIYIDQALQNDTDSVQNHVIIEHAGDIYAQNGEIEKALEYWQEALKAGSENALLSKKIELRKYLKEK